MGRCGDAFSVLWQILDNTPYSQLQPAAQAALQRASAIAMRRMMPARLPMPTVVQQLVQAVPFLLDTDFLDAARHAAWFGEWSFHTIWTPQGTYILICNDHYIYCQVSGFRHWCVRSILIHSSCNLAGLLARLSMSLCPPPSADTHAPLA